LPTDYIWNGLINKLDYGGKVEISAFGKAETSSFWYFLELSV